MEKQRYEFVNIQKLYKINEVNKKMMENKIYKEDIIRDNYRRLTNLLIKKELTISTMESATSGQIASLITDTEGASAVLKGAFITYCNEAKIMQGVPAQTIETYSVYSKETAIAMAKRCREVYAADIGIGVTGTMGNVDPANPEFSEPGKVYFAISIKSGTNAFYVELPKQDSRYMYKMAVAEEVYQQLMKIIG